MSVHVVRDHASRRVSHRVPHPELMNAMCRYEILYVFNMLTAQVIVVGALKQKLALKYFVLSPKLVDDTHEAFGESHEIIDLLCVLLRDIDRECVLIADVPLVQSLFPNDQSEYFLNLDPRLVHLFASQKQLYHVFASDFSVVFENFVD